MKKIGKRFLAYIIDMMVVLVIAQSISGIPFLNKKLNQYTSYYNEYTALVEQYTKFKTQLKNDFDDEKITLKEYQKLVDDYPSYQDVLDTYYQDEAITSKEYKKIVTKIDSDYEKEYKRLFYQIEKNSTTYFIVYLIVIFGYFVLFNKFTNGQTLGKKLCRLKIVNAKDSREDVSILAFLIRALVLYQPIYYLVKLIGIYCLSSSHYYTVTSIVYDFQYYLECIIVIMILIRADGRGLHDLLAKTRVMAISKEGELIEEETPSLMNKMLESKNDKKKKKIVDEPK